MESSRRPWLYQSSHFEQQQQQQWRRLAVSSGVVITGVVVLASSLEVALWRHEHSATSVEASTSASDFDYAHMIAEILTWRAAVDALIAALALIRLFLLAIVVVATTNDDQLRGRLLMDNSQRLVLIEEEEDDAYSETSSETVSEGSGLSPYDRASLFSRLSYGWISPIIDAGKSRRLDMEDVPELPRDDSTFAAAEKFRRALANEKRRHFGFSSADGDVVTDSPSFLRMAQKLYGWDIAGFALWSTGNKLLGLAGPLLLKFFLDWADRPDSVDNLSLGYSLAFLMAVRSLLSAISSTQYGLAWKRFDLRVRAGLMSAIYDRTLSLGQLSSASTDGADGSNGVGKITNLLSVDVGRVVGMPGTLFDAFLIPLEIILALALLHSAVSFAFIAGLAMLAIMLPVQTLLGGAIQRVTRDMLGFRDSRVSAAAECIRGIRTLKLLAWDSVFLNKMAGLRGNEMGRLAVRKYLDALCVFFWASTPVLVQTAVFVTLILLLHRDLSAANAFTAIALLDRLIFPMNYFPWIINGFLEARVSALRIRAFLFDAEGDSVNDDADVTLLQNWEMVYADQEPVLEIRDGVFEWDSDTFANEPRNDEWISPDTPLLSAEYKSEGTTDPTSFFSPSFSLRVNHLMIRPNAFYIVCGRVGAGKSSLLHALLGEMPLLQGSLHMLVKGNSPLDSRPRISFAPQTPWLMNASVRQNVTLCEDDDVMSGAVSVNDERYKRVLRACQLEEELRARDNDRVAEQGSNFSGGQRARIALARALYQRTPLYLLDDPLSGLDNNTGRAIMSECFSRTATPDGYGTWSDDGVIPRGAAVVIVTHAVHLLEQYALRNEGVQVVLLEDGSVVESGSFAELQARPDGHLSNMLIEASAHSRASSDSNASEQSGTTVMGPRTTAESTKKDKAASASKEITHEGEFRQAGSVHWKVWQAYAAAIGWPLAGALVASVIVMQTSRNGLDWWIAHFTGSVDSSGDPKISPHMFAVVLLGITGVNLVAVLLRSFLFAYGGLQAANRTYAALVSSVFSAPLSFFDITPGGRILNRLSGDTYTVDESLPFTLNIFVKDLADVIGALVIVLYGNWFVALVLVPLIFVYRVMQRDYRPTSRHVKRLDAVTQSPLLARLTETLDGLRVIRALKHQRAFSRAYVRRIHANQRTSFLGANTGAWFGLRLDLLGVCITSFVAVSAVVDHNTGAGSSSASSMGNAGILGLTLTYALPIVGKLNSALNSFIDTERQMIAVERLHEYALLPSEEEHVAPLQSKSDTDVVVVNSTTPPSWPRLGHIVVKDLTVRYDTTVFGGVHAQTASFKSSRAKALPKALSNVSFEVKPGEHVGICGRTGAGKSTLLRAFFRAVRWDHPGSIAIDGINLESLPLRFLRSRLTYIPQDIVLFAGTIRSNLDPENQFADEQLWEVLGRCGALDLTISRLQTGLDSVIGGGRAAREGSGVGEGGHGGGDDDDVLSRGQRQLLCVARALLRPSKLLCVDEATSAMDPATERAVNEVPCFQTYGLSSDANVSMLARLGLEACVYGFDSAGSCSSDCNSYGLRPRVCTGRW